MISFAAALALIVGLALSSRSSADERATGAPKPDADGFYRLFDGKTLDGWKVGKHPETWRVVDGTICAQGPGPSHLFYVGPVKGHDFKDFHFRAEVMTFPNANSGIYYHTKFQEEGWPSQGYEAQVNNSYAKDPRKTASFYAVKDVKEAVARDNEWFTYEIIVRGKEMTIRIDGKTVNEMTEPDDHKPPRTMPGRKLSGGTFALQGHDPGSKVCFRNIMVKPLDG